LAAYSDGSGFNLRSFKIQFLGRHAPTPPWIGVLHTLTLPHKLATGPSSYSPENILGSAPVQSHWKEGWCWTEAAERRIGARLPFFAYFLHHCILTIV